MVWYENLFLTVILMLGDSLFCKKRFLSMEKARGISNQDQSIQVATIIAVVLFCSQIDVKQVSDDTVLPIASVWHLLSGLSSDILIAW